jgi:hypothetical protein
MSFITEINPFAVTYDMKLEIVLLLETGGSFILCPSLCCEFAESCRALDGSFEGKKLGNTKECL